MELRGYEVGVHRLRQLKHLHDRVLGVTAAEAQPRLGQPIQVGGIDLEAVPETFADHRPAVVEPACETGRLDEHILGAEAHGSALISDIPLVWH